VGGTAVLSLAYIVYFSTLVAYSLWSWLLAHHPATTVTPFALLVPVVGLLSSAVMLGESMPAWKMAVAGLVMTGLALNVFGPKWQNGAKPVDAPRTPGAAPRQLR
jgi:O-acetylserine/cysteine efflux transporter